VRLLLAVVADRVLRTDSGGFLGKSGLVGAFGLLVKIHVTLVVVVFQDRVNPGDFHTGTARSARVVDVPRARNVLG
jgi:hypothetical protein